MNIFMDFYYLGGRGFGIYCFVLSEVRGVVFFDVCLKFILNV